MENFSGFKPAMEACQLTWEDYPIPGVTYSTKDGQRWNYRFSSKFHDGGDVKKPSRVQPVTICSEDIISTDNSRNLAHSQRSQELRSRAGRMEVRGIATRRDSCLNDGAASSGSEGFCEPENRHFRDSDSSLDNTKGFHSRSNSLDEAEMSPGEAGEGQQEGSPRSQDQQEGEVFEEGGVGLASVSKGSKEKGRAADGCAQDSAKPVLSSDLSAKGSSQPAAAATSGGAANNVDPSSESQQSSDEYQMYFYDTKAKVGDMDKRKKEKSDEPNLFSGLKKMENVQEVRCLCWLVFVSCSNTALFLYLFISHFFVPFILEVGSVLLVFVLSWLCPVLSIFFFLCCVFCPFALMLSALPFSYLIFVDVGRNGLYEAMGEEWLTQGNSLYEAMGEGWLTQGNSLYEAMGEEWLTQGNSLYEAMGEEWVSAKEIACMRQWVRSVTQGNSLYEAMSEECHPRK